MEALVVRGGIPLQGEVEIHGAKNAVLPILAASVIGGGTYLLHNCPQITDVELAAEIINGLGGQVNVHPERTVPSAAQKVGDEGGNNGGDPLPGQRAAGDGTKIRCKHKSAPF